MPFRIPQPHQLDALCEIAGLTRKATGALEIEICSRSGSTSRTFVKEGDVPSDIPVHRREATMPMPIGSDLVVSASFTDRPDEDVTRALAQAATGAVAVLGNSAMIEPGREDDSPFALFDTAPIPMWIYDIATSRFLDVNAYAIARYGYTRNEFLDMRIDDLRPSDGRSVIDEERIRRGGFTVWKHQQHIWKTGQVRDVAIVSYDIDYQERAARLVMVDDITDQLRAEQTKDLLLAGVENLDELVIIFQLPSGERTLPRITFVNAAFERILGWDRSQLLTGEGVREITSGLNEAVTQSLARLLSERKAAQLELDARDSTGQVRRLDFRIVPVWTGDDAAGIAHWVAVARDTTEERAIADRSLQAQRLEAMGLLAGGIAHDFNNLVVAISGFSQLALKQLAPDSRAADDIRQVHAAAGRAAALAQQLLAFSRRQELSPQQIDLCALVNSLEPMLRRLVGSHIRVIVECVEQGIELVADRTQMEQVVLNLVVNARDAQPDGGWIRIKTSRATSDSLSARFPEIRRRDDQHWICLSVSDNGSGIPPEIRDRVFEPFYTTRPTGTGLGLSTVHGIVTQSGGLVSISSEQGHGTEVTVVLPNPPAENVMNESVVGDATRNRRTVDANILVLGDSAASRRRLREDLGSTGAQVMVASSMAEAAKCLQSTTEMHAVVMDFEDIAAARRAHEQLRQLRPQVAVLSIGHGLQDDGHAVVVDRPTNKQALHDAVQRLLAKRNSTAG
jgi:PAS domain S-box-containing protein